MKLSQGIRLKADTYVIDSLVRTTECSHIYAATIKSTGHPILIHRLQNDYAGYADIFIEKARILAESSHPAIVNVTDIFMEDDTAYYVTEYIQGRSLSDVASTTPMHEKQAEHIVTLLAGAADEFHKKGIPNLAITPDDIVIRETDGMPVVISFSLPLPLFVDYNEQNPYHAPERYEATGRNNPAHDIYSLGAILYFCVTSHRPPLCTEIEINGIEYPVAVTDSIADIINKALAPRILNRYYSINDFISAFDNDSDDNTIPLSHYISHEPEQQPSVLQPEPTPEMTPEPTPEPESEPQQPISEAESKPESTPTTQLQPITEHEPQPELPIESKSGKRKVTKFVVIGVAIFALIAGIFYIFRPKATQSTQTITAPILEDSDHRDVTDTSISVGPTKFSYTGTVNADGLPDGEGTATYKGGLWSSYTGEWKEGLWHGHGQLTYNIGDVYDGNFADNSFTTGKYTVNPKSRTSDAGSYFEGSFMNGTPYDGTWYAADGKPFDNVSKGITSHINDKSSATNNK